MKKIKSGLEYSYSAQEEQEECQDLAPSHLTLASSHSLGPMELSHSPLSACPIHHTPSSPRTFAHSFCLEHLLLPISPGEPLF